MCILKDSKIELQELIKRIHESVIRLTISKIKEDIEHNEQQSSR